MTRFDVIRPVICDLLDVHYGPMSFNDEVTDAIMRAFEADAAFVPFPTLPIREVWMHQTPGYPGFDHVAGTEPDRCFACFHDGPHKTDTGEYVKCSECPS